MAAPNVSAPYREDHLIPARMVGLVIGRGGEQIKRLQYESNCRIRINAGK